MICESKFLLPRSITLDEEYNPSFFFGARAGAAPIIVKARQIRDKIRNFLCEYCILY